MDERPEEVTDFKRGVTAEVSVTWQDKELDYGTLNLLATRSRDGLVRKIDRANLNAAALEG